MDQFISGVQMLPSNDSEERTKDNLQGWPITRVEVSQHEPVDFCFGRLTFLSHQAFSNFFLSLFQSMFASLLARHQGMDAEYSVLRTYLFRLMHARAD